MDVNESSWEPQNYKEWKIGWKSTPGLSSPSKIVYDSWIGLPPQLKAQVWREREIGVALFSLLEVLGNDDYTVGVGLRDDHLTVIVTYHKLFPALESLPEFLCVPTMIDKAYGYSESVPVVKEKG